MYIFNIGQVTNKVNPYSIKKTKKAIIDIHENFCETFEKNYVNRINSKGYEKYKDLIDGCMYYLFMEELKALLLGTDNKIKPDYYIPFNKEVAFAFHNCLDKSTHRYGGYSVVQICREITDKAHELDPKGFTTIAIHNNPGCIGVMAKKLTKHIKNAFAAYREVEREKFLSSVKGYPWGTLTPKANYNSLDPTLRTNAIAQCACHMTLKGDSKYMSFPVAKGHYIAGQEQDRNLNALIGALVDGYTRGHGYSVLLEAGTGLGKTYLIANRLSGVLGELCDTQVYMTMPTTAQIGQMDKSYDLDVRYSEKDISGEGHNAKLRAYIYDLVDQIPTTVKDPYTGADKGVILVIDEAHSLLTEKYRGKTLRRIVNKAKAILSAGGIVISMSASTEMISATTPYNNLSGYDLICKLFRVSNTNPIKKEGTEIAYPCYSFEDAVRYGEVSGVSILNAIPADKIEVIYQNDKDLNMSSSLASLIIQAHGEGRKVIAEYNKTDQLTETKHILEKQGIRVVVCCAKDKKFKWDETGREKTYHNKVYNGIINNNCIDFTDVDVVLTTKLLENGTTINNITVQGTSDTELSEIKRKITTIFAVDKRNQWDMEAAEQFSGRVRFDHEKAVFLIPEPKSGLSTKLTLEHFMRRGMGRIEDIADLLEKSLITASRLHYIDFMGNEDMPEGMDESGEITTEAMAEAMYRAVRNYNKSLMYNKSIFEEVVRNRYQKKTVTFSVSKPATIKIQELRRQVSDDGEKAIKQAITDAFSNEDVRKQYIKGYDSIDKENKHGKDKETLPVIKEMTEYSRSSYTEPMRTAASIVFSLQDIEQYADNNKAMLVSAPKKVLRPEHLPESFGRSVASAISCDTKRDINSLMNDSIADGFKFLSQFKAMSEPIKRYAMKYGDKDKAAPEDLVAECMNLLPDYPAELKEKIRALMQTLFDSDKKKRIDRLVYTCTFIKNVDMDFYASIASYKDTEIDQTAMVYQFSNYGLDPASIHAASTPSGATFEAITGRAAIRAILEEDSKDVSLKDWEGKRITKQRATLLYERYKNYMMKNGYPFDSSVESGRLKILRLFASVFTFSQAYGHDGDVYITLGKLRKKRPMDFDQIIHLNFRNTYRSKKGSFLMRFDDNGDHLDDCPDYIPEDNPLMLRCVEIRHAMESEIRDRYYRVILLQKPGEPIKVVGDVESTRSGAVLTMNKDEDIRSRIRFVNGFDKEIPDGKYGFVVLSEEKRDKLLNIPDPTDKDVAKLLA